MSGISKVLNRNIYERLEYYHSRRKCVVGVCAMKKKSSSKTMIAILDRLRAYGTFHIEVFDEKMIFDEKVENWPLCDCLIAFYSSGFPLDKAVEYVKLREPFCVNDVESQYILKNRLETKELLRKHGLPVLPHLLVDRRNNKKPQVKQTDEYIEVDGKQFSFPLVEKPLDADDHNIYIYYGHGKGSRRLFRKIGNRSSQAYPHIKEIRTDKTYMYEPFLPMSKDIKVYTLGPGYAHAETRKSPSVDGHVLRDIDGKELRLSCLLHENERQNATKLVNIIKQNVCGFDLIRHGSRSYIIDVNGWSFVKNNMRYDDKAARTLRKMFLYSEHGRRALRFTSLFEQMNSISWNKNINQWQQTKSVMKLKDGETGDILRGMVCLFRHGDRTPKQKIKTITSHPSMLQFYFNNCHNNKYEELYWRGEEVVKLISSITDILNNPTPKDNIDVLNAMKERVKLAAPHSKFQIRPKKFDKNQKVISVLLICKWGGDLTHTGIEQTETYASLFTEEMFPPVAPITPVVTGRNWNLSSNVNSEYTMKPSNSYVYTNPKYRKLLHDFFKDTKVYASAETRVRATAKAFLRGLDVFKEVKSDMVLTNEEVHQYLDLIPKDAKNIMQQAKDAISKLVNSKEVLLPLGSKNIDSNYTQICQHLRQIPKLASSPSFAPFLSSDNEFNGDKSEMNRMTRWGIRCLRWLHRRHEDGKEEGPYALINEVYDIMKSINAYILDFKLPKNKVLFEEYSYDEQELASSDEVEYDFHFELLCSDENLQLLQFRWKMLIDSFYDEEKDKYDITKVPDVYDTIKYDTLHNIGFFPFMRPLYRAAKRLTSFVVPQEYGLLKQDKLKIGQLIAQPLMNRMVNHLSSCLELNNESRVALYFSSESHLHSLRNILLLSSIPQNQTVHNMLEDLELSYMSHCVIRLYEDVSQPIGSAERFYINLQFSPGACLDPFIFKQAGHLQLVSRPMPICGHVPFETFKKLLYDNSIEE